MRHVILASALAWTTVVGCTDLAKGGSSTAALTPDGYSGPVLDIGSIPSTGPVPEGCVRMAADSLGEYATLTIGSRTVTLTGWTLKEGSNAQYVRFSFEASGPVAYAVKAGKETFRDNVLLWAHPGGLSGRLAQGISDITFCAAPPGTGGAAPSGTDAGVPTKTGTNTTTAVDPSSGYGGAACTMNAQCWSGDCYGGQCLPGWSFDRCVDGARDCLSGECTVLGCAPIPNGERDSPCTTAFTCWSGACVNGICQGGDIGDACRSSDDCQIPYECDTATTQSCLVPRSSFSSFSTY